MYVPHAMRLKKQSQNYPIGTAATEQVQALVVRPIQDRFLFNRLPLYRTTPIVEKSLIIYI
jgi:hypothetical protein